MREKHLTSAAVVAIALAAIFAGAGQAQPYKRDELLKRGNDSFNSNCVVSAMNYYAILQQFPGWPNADAVRRMRQRIEVCRQGSAGLSGTGWIGKEITPAGGLAGRTKAGEVGGRTATKATSEHAPQSERPQQDAALADSLLLPISLPSQDEPARTRACRAYAETALVQVYQQTAGQCRHGGEAWSDSYDHHYRWCMETATPQTLRARIAERNAVLDRCVFQW